MGLCKVLMITHQMKLLYSRILFSVSVGTLTIVSPFLLAAQDNQGDVGVDAGVDPLLEAEDFDIPEEEVRIQVRTEGSRHIFFTATANVNEALYYLDEGDAFPVTPAFRMLADPVFLNGSSTVTLARSYEDEEGEILYEPIASVEMAEAVRHAIVVIVPRESDGGTEYRLLYFDHGLDAHPLNTARFINVSPREILVQMDDENFSIPPFEEAVKDVGTSQTHLTMRAGVVIRQEGRILDTSRQQFRQGTRVLFLGFPDRRPRYGTIFTVIRHRDLGPPE